MDEHTLVEKLRKIEALHAGATTPGERDAAAHAIQRMLEHLERLRKQDPPIEYRFSLPDVWSRRLFCALVRRYGLSPYRYSGQRHTTVMVRVPQKFVAETLWPEFLELDRTLRVYLDEVTNRVISVGIHKDSSEAEVQAELHRLTGGR